MSIPEHGPLHFTANDVSSPLDFGSNSIVFVTECLDIEFVTDKRQKNSIFNHSFDPECLLYYLCMMPCDFQLRIFHLGPVYKCLVGTDIHIYPHDKSFFHDNRGQTSKVLVYIEESSKNFNRYIFSEFI